MNRWLRSWPIDLAVGAVTLFAGTADVLALDERDGPLWAHIALVVVAATAYTIRRRRPILATASWVSAMALAAALITTPANLVIAFVGLLLLAYALGAHADARPGLAGLVSLAVLVVVVDASSPDADSVFPAIISGAAYLAGRVARSRSELTAELHEAALAAEEAQQSETALAMAAERRRIAREMHDVVAHSISVMVVQAGGARRILDRDPERAVDAAAQIERTGREALAEMRQLLGVLRPDERGPELEPQPGLGGLDALLDRARGAGLPVELTVEGERRDVPPGLDLAAYRIVQESLTNALKHAGAAATRVELRWTDAALEIRVENAPGRSLGTLPGTGQGLPGMRERVRMFGGDVHAAPRPGGGFEVRATLPLVTEEVPA